MNRGVGPGSESAGKQVAGQETASYKEKKEYYKEMSESKRGKR